MITYKDITLEDLKKDYSTTKGFVFQGKIPSSDESVEKLCEALIKKQVTNSYPDFVAKLDPNIHVFVYEKDFDMPMFLQRSDMLSKVLGGEMTVDSLYNFLKN